jgi:hypothetical protein
MSRFRWPRVFPSSGVAASLGRETLARGLCDTRLMSAEVGADVESICSKCGDVWHVVVAKVEDRIAKVQCKECGATHRHRPPAGAAAAPKKKRTTRKAAKAAEPVSVEPTVEPDLSKPVQPYRIDGSYEPGDRIEHSTFGTGVVESASTPGKIGVFFPDGRKILAAAKPAPRLEPGGRAGPGPASEDSGG